jgi:heterodisulfide reductase subunit A-like polyferredoxin
VIIRVAWTRVIPIEIRDKFRVPLQRKQAINPNFPPSSQLFHYLNYKHCMIYCVSNYKIIYKIDTNQNNVITFDYNVVKKVFKKISK